MNVGMLPELAAIRVQGAEKTNIDTQFMGKAQHRLGGSTKQVVEQ